MLDIVIIYFYNSLESTLGNRDNAEWDYEIVSLPICDTDNKLSKWFNTDLKSVISFQCCITNSEWFEIIW